MMTPEEFNRFYSLLPRCLKKIARSYPPGRYRIKHNAPFPLLRPGSEVEIKAYKNTREVRVVLKAQNKLSETIKREEILGLKYGKTREEIDSMHKQDIEQDVPLIWLERINDEENNIQLKLFKK